MRILLLTQVLPYPPDSGPKIKTYYVLKYLVQHHQVTLVSFVRETDKPEYVNHLQSMCDQVITVSISRSSLNDIRYLAQSIVSGKPWMMLRDERREMKRELAKLAVDKPFDIVHADQLNMAQYAVMFKRSRKVLDLHNALWLLYKRMCEATSYTDPMKYILMRDWRLLKGYEGKICHHFDAVTAVTDEDRQLLIEAGAQEDITVIPIAIDTDEQSWINRKPASPHIVHIGTMYWPPNINGITWFLDKIYPLIKSKVPDVTFTIIGSRPPESIIQRSQIDSSIKVTGYVENPIPILESSSLMVVPLLAGGGMRVKILNALSQGIPMVSTSVGCEGIKVIHNRDILIADNPSEFASECVRLLVDHELNKYLSISGRQTVEQYYDYRQACQPLDGIYSSLMASR